MSAEYVRRCPTCGTENAPQVMRCACGALLAGVDLVNKTAAPADALPPEVPVAASTSPSLVVCSYADCAQSNPAGSATCVYCNRPLAGANDGAGMATTSSLLRLPAALAQRFEIQRALPTAGAEAELLLVRALSGGPVRVAKIYRHGIQPRADVQERMARIGVEHRVQVLESGVSEGHAYELMEYCEGGSLRNWLQAGRLPVDRLKAVVRELAQALAGVHDAGLLHRDLKPDNVLVRSAQPLDLVLTDFSISSVLDATQRFTGMARTLPYASPESLSGVIDGKCDYWALGMIVLEALLGQHPFAGLSEAVILHHLTTRGMDLTGIADPAYRKLLRGLLLRDPQQRWGAPELTRWLADDASLPEPAEQKAGAQFNAPYHLGSETCYSPTQLAVALARDWEKGVSDVSNGLLQAWFREVQQDQNTLRLLLEMRHERKTPPDLQLLQLILHLAPGIPPVWRGESIELPAILSRADLALKGDAQAARWLQDVHENRVLEAYAQAGNQQVASIVQKWGAAADEFADAWAAGQALLQKMAPAKSPGDYADFDDLMYGQHGQHGQHGHVRPALAHMHAHLLAMAYDPQWAARQRLRLQAELTGLLVHCPWLGELGDPLTLGAASLLVLEALLPEARGVVKQHLEAQARQREQDVEDGNRIKQEIQVVLAELRAFSRSSLMRPDACANLRATLDRYFEVLARVKASGRSDQDWQPVQKAVGRPQRAARRMLQLVDQLAERRAENLGWFSRQTLGFAAMAVLVLPIFMGTRITYGLVAVALGVVAWRLWPNFQLTREIRALAASI